VGDERALAEENKGAALRAAATELAHRKKPRREWRPVCDSVDPDMEVAPYVSGNWLTKVYIERSGFHAVSTKAPGICGLRTRTAEILSNE